MLKNCLNEGLLEAGCDEAGRGCLAGPVYAAAVILPAHFENEFLNDSKQLSEAKRYALRPIIEKSALAWGVGVVEAWEIDRINILNASFLAMNRALLELKIKPEFLLIDGNRFRTPSQLPWHKLEESSMERLKMDVLSNIPFSCEIKGDGRFKNIAAASILAKTYRDDCMLALSKECPEYGWDSNKGYPTSSHRAAIRAIGLSKHHRLSFKQLEDQLTLDF